jgi:GYF domain 2
MKNRLTPTNYWMRTKAGVTIMMAECNWIGWYYRRGRRQVGPVTRSRIARLIVGGQLRRSDQVWKAWNEADEFRLVPAKASEALYSTSTALPRSMQTSTRGTFLN